MNKLVLSLTEHCFVFNLNSSVSNAILISKIKKLKTPLIKK